GVAWSGKLDIQHIPISLHLKTDSQCGNWLGLVWHGEESWISNLSQSPHPIKTDRQCGKWQGLVWQGWISNLAQFQLHVKTDHQCENQPGLVWYRTEGWIFNVS
ncbi:hypothetical protein AVEN_138718-1, partial [Araneus ventricosus]